MQAQTDQKNPIKATLILTLTAIIWGLGFVAQRVGMQYIGPFFFNGFRSILGSLTLTIIVLLLRFATKKKQTEQTDAPFSSILIRGILCGLPLFFAGNLQQVGLVYTTAGKAGFITSFYIILVPVVGIFLKRKTHWNTWAGVVLATVGIFFLSVTTDFTIQIGDIIVFASACFWTAHILVIDHAVSALRQMDVLRLCCVQFAVAGVLSFLAFPALDGFFTEGIVNMDAILDILPSALYTGCLSTGVGFTLQAVGQKYANPAPAAIIMSTEAIFSLIGGMIILNEVMHAREWLGCLLMFVAVILSQVPISQKRKKHSILEKL
ncbi:MAG: DMT family transporter [Clostridiales Family XIII bacterium]|jgi:drug/metabolite transporter (DMT)-like permease|nr:DMT family transporter [Clostridiales Family XIII bacterium]